MKKDRENEPPFLSKGLTVFDPENPPFEPQHLCVYLRELEDGAREEEARSDDHLILPERD